MAQTESKPTASVRGSSQFSAMSIVSATDPATPEAEGSGSGSIRCSESPSWAATQTTPSRVTAMPRGVPLTPSTVVTVAPWSVIRETLSLPAFVTQMPSASSLPWSRGLPCAARAGSLPTTGAPATSFVPTAICVTVPDALLATQANSLPIAMPRGSEPTVISAICSPSGLYRRT